MKEFKKLGCSFRAFQIILTPADVKPEISEKKKDVSDQLLDVIYAPDPVTRLPQNDVAVYLSDKVDPMIKEFIASNLMSPNPDVKGVPDENSDLLFDLIRGQNESVSDYAVRVRGIIEADNEIRIKEAVLNDDSKPTENG